MKRISAFFKNIIAKLIGIDIIMLSGQVETNQWASFFYVTETDDEGTFHYTVSVPGEYPSEKEAHKAARKFFLMGGLFAA